MSSRALSEQTPLVPPSPTASPPPLPTPEPSITASAPANLEWQVRRDVRIRALPCYQQVSQSAYPCLSSNKFTIVFLRVALTSSMVLFITAKVVLDATAREAPGFLDFFALGELTWILMTARAWLMTYWCLSMYEVNNFDFFGIQYRLYFGIDKKTAESRFSVLYEVTQLVGFFTTAFYAFCMPAHENTLTDYVQAAIYMLPGPLNLFESMFLNTITESRHMFGLTSVAVFGLMFFYLYGWVQLGYFLMEESYDWPWGKIDGRFLGGDRELVFWPNPFVVALVLLGVGIVEVPVTIMKSKVLKWKETGTDNEDRRRLLGCFS